MHMHVSLASECDNIGDDYDGREVKRSIEMKASAFYPGGRHRWLDWTFPDLRVENVRDLLCHPFTDRPIWGEWLATDPLNQLWGLVRKEDKTA